MAKNCLPVVVSVDHATEKTGKSDIGTTKWRFVIITLSWWITFLTAFQYVQYIMIPDVLTEYFSVTNHAVSWTATLMNAVFLITVFPTMWFLEQFDLRIASLVAAGCVFIGTVFKCIVISRSFVFTIMGQCFIGVSNVFVSLLPARIAAEWFPTEEVSMATGIVLSAQIIGNALGVLIPPIVIEGPTTTHNTQSYPADWSDERHNSSNAATDEVHDQMFSLFLVQAIVALVVFLATVTLFKSAPEQPPSYSAQLKMSSSTKPKSVFNMESYKILLRNPQFLLLMVSYGIAIGSSMTFVTLISQILNPFFPDMSPNAINLLVAKMSFTRTIAGVFGSILAGILLDRYRYFKIAFLIDYGLIFASLVGFSICVVFGGVVAQFVLMGTVGLFFNSIFSFAFQLGAEITYPAPESTMTGLLSVTSHFFSFILTQILQFEIEYFESICPKIGSQYSLGTLVAALVFGLFITGVIKEERRRENASKVPLPH